MMKESYSQHRTKRWRFREERKCHMSRRRSNLTFLVGIAAVGLLGWQSANPPAPAPAQGSPAQSQDQKATAGAAGAEKAEMTSQESAAAFHVKVNLVLVRAIVRDAKGEVVGNLRKEDFLLFDNNRPQTIMKFSIEQASTTSAVASRSKEAAAPAQPEASTTIEAPRRYLALYFDDVHASQSDIMNVRAAADRYVNTALHPGDRAGIFTSSGQNNLDFTDDRAQLHQALSKLMTRPVTPEAKSNCPDVDHYQGYLIVEQHDVEAVAVATADALHCRFRDDQQYQQAAQAMAEVEAAHALNAGRLESDYTTRALGEIIQRMSILPGQREVVLVSPGFLELGEESTEMELIDRALRFGVIVNTLDARGLYVPTLGREISEIRSMTPRAEGPRLLLRMEAENREADVLGDLARGTGGIFFHNSNDLDQGFRMTGGLPEVSYLLGYTPSNEKFDGHFHTITVKLSSPGKLSVQARRGYYAPEKAKDADSQAKEDLEEAVFSQDVRNELPMEVHTQFFKLNPADARLSVLTRVDTRYVPFRKAEGRNLDKLVFVTALFDRDGKYISGKERVLEMRLFDATRDKLTQSGITTKASFEVAPGTYLVRLVVRDAEGALLSAQNQTVEIP